MGTDHGEFPRVPESGELLPPGLSTKPKTGGGLYVDVENLRANGQQIIESLLESWPSITAPPTRLCIYVRADFVELWRLWATSRFPQLTVLVKGIQHFSTYASKNSADIALATNAISDLLLGRVTHVVVLSDDSDFISLYVAIRDEMALLQPQRRSVPFLWVITNRDDSVSSTVKQYFPSEYLHVVQVKGEGGGSPSTSQVSQPAETTALHGGTSHQWEDIAEAIIAQIPVGIFKSTNCQPIIKQNWPGHSLANASGPVFGTEFLKRLWPILEKRGVKIANPGKKPIRYEMTQSAKLVQP